MEALGQSNTEVRKARLVALAWEDLVVDSEEEDDAELPRRGWQQKVAECVDTQFVATNVWPILTNQEKALMRSQTGPLSPLPFTVLPTDRFTRFDPQPFRVLLLRRLHFPLPLTARQCRCGRPLDACGHHRSACAVAGVLGRRGCPLETAAAQVCREAGARVRLNTMVRDLDLLPGALLDNGRLEVVADGLSLFNGAQLAIDTTMVSALRGDGTARRGAQHTSGTAIMSARRRKELTCPELSGDGGRARLVVLATGGRWSQDTSVLGRVGKGQVPRGTTSTARQCEGRLVAQVELSLRLHCSSVFCVVPRRRPHTIGERCVVGHAPHVSASFASLD